MNTDISVIKKYRGTQEKNVNDFLWKFVSNIATSSTKYCRQYIKQWGYMDYNLLATERGVYSLLSASVDAITPIHKSEMEVIRRADLRKKGNQDKKKIAAGRVDLWCDKDGIEFFFEFKRTYISPEYIIKPFVPGKIKDAWKTLADQVDEMKDGVRYDPDSGYQGYESSTVFVGMHIITLRQRSKDYNKIKAALAEKRINCEIIKSWSEHLPKPTPNCIIEWNICQDAHKFREIDWNRKGKPIQWAAFLRHLFCFNIEFNDRG